MRIRAFKNFKNLAFKPASPVCSHYARCDSVAMQDPLHFALRQKQVLPPVVGSQETVAIAMTANSSRDKTGLIGKRVIT